MEAKTTMPELEELYNIIRVIKPELSEYCKMLILKYGTDDDRCLVSDLEVVLQKMDYLFSTVLKGYVYGNKEKNIKGLEHYINSGRFAKVNDIYDDIYSSIILPCDIIYSILRECKEARFEYKGKIYSAKEIDLIANRVSAILNRAMLASVSKYGEIIDRTFNDIIGQTEAKKKIKQLLIRKNIETAISTKHKIVTMLFTGPTGTGKTQSCKNMARLLYGSENAMFRIDMNEYRSDEVGANTLKGMPRGYKDAETKSPFVQFISTHKEGIILLDEFEKACDPIKNFFYKIIDEGWFEDNQGRKYNISKYIIVATTNAYSRTETDNIFGVKSETTGKSMMECLNEKLGSALVGRFNAVIEYLALTREEAIEIIKLNLKKSLEKKIRNVASATRTNVTVEYEPSIDDFAIHLLDLNNDQFKENGARVLIEQVDSIWDMVIPELSMVFATGIKEYEKSKVTIGYIGDRIDVRAKKLDIAPLSYTGNKKR